MYIPRCHTSYHNHKARAPPRNFDSKIFLPSTWIEPGGDIDVPKLPLTSHQLSHPLPTGVRMFVCGYFT